MACGGSPANPWLHWSGGLRRSRPKRPRVATTLTRTQTHSSPGPTWRPASSCHASTGTSLRTLLGSPWKTSTRSTTRTRGWDLPTLFERAVAPAFFFFAGPLSGTGAERLHHFRSLLDAEMGLVSFDLQSRSGCCPLTVCLWKNGRGSQSQSLFVLACDTLLDGRIIPR